MSRFRHALAERDSHILTLRAVIVCCACVWRALATAGIARRKSSPSGSRRICAAAAPARGGKCRPPAFTPSPFIYSSS